MCDEIRLTLAEVRRSTPSAEPAWGPRGTTPRLTVRGTTAGAPPPPPPPPHHTTPHHTTPHNTAKQSPENGGVIRNQQGEQHNIGGVIANQQREHHSIKAIIKASQHHNIKGVIRNQQRERHSIRGVIGKQQENLTSSGNSLEMSKEDSPQRSQKNHWKLARKLRRMEAPGFQPKGTPTQPNPAQFRQPPPTHIQPLPQPNQRAHKSTGLPPKPNQTHLNSTQP